MKFVLDLLNYILDFALKGAGVWALIMLGLLIKKCGEYVGGLSKRGMNK